MTKFNSAFLLSMLIAFATTTSIQAKDESLDNTVKVMTFNVLRDRWAPKGSPDWGTRRNVVFATIKTHMPAIIGLQEEEGSQLKDILKNLPSYESPTSWNRGGGHLLLHKASWKVIGKGKIGIPRRRDVSWVLAESTTNHQKWLFYNAHFWHDNENDRMTAAKAITKHVMESELDNIPVVLLGDLNCTDESPTFKYLCSEKDEMTTFRDSYAAIKKNNLMWGTYHGFTGKKEGKRIDYILVNKNVQVIDSAILNEKEGDVYSSDHYPVLATLKRGSN